MRLRHVWSCVNMLCIDKNQIQLTGMNGFVDVEGGLLREALQADVTAERSLAGVRSHVDVQVRFARERGRALFALEWPFLNCAQGGQIGCLRVRVFTVKMNICMYMFIVIVLFVVLSEYSDHITGSTDITGVLLIVCDVNGRAHPSIHTIHPSLHAHTCT